MSPYKLYISGKNRSFDYVTQVAGFRVPLTRYFRTGDGTLECRIYGQNAATEVYKDRRLSATEMVIRLLAEKMDRVDQLK